MNELHTAAPDDTRWHWWRNEHGTCSNSLAITHELSERLMITQYDAVAEIEAMKLRTIRIRSERPNAEAAAGDRQWSRSGEREIREEMERRLARRANRS